MCTISEKFKLCSCNPEKINADNPAPYWELYRFSAEQTTITMGELIVLEVFDPMLEKENKEKISKRLLDPDVFDFNPDLQEEDLLALHFGSPHKDYREWTYSYVFKSGAWTFKEVSVFDISNDYRYKAAGKIEN